MGEEKTLWPGGASRAVTHKGAPGERSLFKRTLAPTCRL